MSKEQWSWLVLVLLAVAVRFNMNEPENNLIAVLYVSGQGGYAVYRLIEASKKAEASTP